MKTKKTSPALETEILVGALQKHFETALAAQLNLCEIQAPLFVWSDSGLNDNLNGLEKAVSFKVTQVNDRQAEVVHSLAKWKRMALFHRKFEKYEGIYVNMNAIRADEKPGPLHSLFVDQWDWEKVIDEKDRTISYLQSEVLAIYEAIKKTEAFVAANTNEESYLPADIHFIHAEDLLQLYPTLSPKERENRICEKYKAVFLIGIGGKLSHGEAHDGRAPDYDDWISETKPSYCGLNGDLLLWNPILKCAHEISSMGIRVNPESLKLQLRERDAELRMSLPFHKSLLSGALPQTIGGGIGRSRLAMYLLRKAHIGEVQLSVWPEEFMDTNMALLQ